MNGIALLLIILKVVFLLVIFIVKKFKMNKMNFLNLLDFADLELLADDDIDFDSEKKVSITFYFVIIFLVIQALFINIIIWGRAVFTELHFLNSSYFINIIIIVLNLGLLIVLRRLIITMRIERNNLIMRIKEKNLLRLDWEKQSQLHDRNHHLGMLYMLLQTGYIDKASTYLKGMVGELQNINAIVRSGNEALNALIYSKIARARELCVDIKIEVLNSLSPMNIYDWDLIRIIGNLLDNAIEAVEDDDRKKSVELLIEGGKENNWIEVITHGVYISDELEARIFQKGYSSKEEAGHGLGLAICKEIVERYRGSISVNKDKEKRYVSFQVLLPVSK